MGPKPPDDLYLIYHDGQYKLMKKLPHGGYRYVL